MADRERPQHYTIPTELGRADVTLDLIVLGVSIWIAGWLAKDHPDLLIYVAVFVPFIAAEVLSGEAAGDVRWGVGAIASVFRSQLGLRRAHAWVLAYVHYLVVAIWPVIKDTCTKLRLRFVTRISNILQILHGASGVRPPLSALRYWKKF